MARGWVKSTGDGAPRCPGRCSPAGHPHRMAANRRNQSRRRCRGRAHSAGWRWARADSRQQLPLVLCLVLLCDWRVGTEGWEPGVGLCTPVTGTAKENKAAMSHVLRPLSGAARRIQADPCTQPIACPPPPPRSSCQVLPRPEHARKEGIPGHGASLQSLGRVQGHVTRSGRCW